MLNIALGAILVVLFGVIYHAGDKRRKDYIESGVSGINIVTIKGHEYLVGYGPPVHSESCECKKAVK